MIETNASPSHVTLAHRITPVTSRGRPVFLPAPPPATSEDQEEREFGSVSLHKASHSFSHPQTYHSHYSDPDLIVTNSDSTFSAVVHGKIRDSSSLARASSAYPVTPQISRVKQSAAPEAPPSPVAYGDLAALLEEAALLEKTLSNGELPSETDHHHHHIVQAEPDTTPSLVIEIVEEPSIQPAAPVRSRSFFRNPLTRNESTTRTEPPTREAHTRASRSGFVTPPNISESPAQHITVSAPMLDNGSTVTVNIENDVPPTPPPKSPRPRYLSGLRRLASSSRSSHTMPGAYPRNSISTSSEISSEDSMPIITPSEHSLESPSSTSEFGRRSSHGSHVPWPSVSPKKNGGSISRAASFAEKIWHRARTKSAASTVSRAEIAAAESMAEAMPLYHPMMPSNAIPETLEPAQNQRVIIPPLRSTSLHRTSPKTPPHVSPVSVAPSPHANTPFISPNSHPPGSRDTLIPSLMADRPTSWVSVSSTGSSLASPLFDKELFDAFPGVPQIIPSVPTGHYRNKSRPSLPIPSFESLPSPLSLQSSGAQSSASTDLHTYPALIPHGTKSLGRASTSPWLRTSTEATR
ncbi:hypothetical protein BD779DRAFT_758971 [Infundibulicybe gibba]|nr:hypothetical protein BD779DRAFT_758971 [Infundibulicybe gibba]